jgi:hypothetical protein
MGRTTPPPREKPIREPFTGAPYIEVEVERVSEHDRVEDAIEKLQAQVDHVRATRPRPPRPKPPENVAYSEWRTPPPPPKCPPMHRRTEGDVRQFNPLYDDPYREPPVRPPRNLVEPIDWLKVLEVLSIIGVALFVLGLGYLVLQGLAL